jgi:hypothetical protein|nr:MAG TPA: hypothetical protein [Caudoviricetes sp.]
MKYRIDWIQFAAALITIAAFTAALIACVTMYLPWPVTVPTLTVAAIASCVWQHRYEANKHEEQDS